jgi:hypothetical protein
MPDFKSGINIKAKNGNDELPVVVTNTAEQNQLGVDITVRFPKNWFVNTGLDEALIVGTGRFSSPIDGLENTSFSAFGKMSALISVQSKPTTAFKGQFRDIVAQCKLPDFKQRGFKLTDGQQSDFKATTINDFPAVIFSLPREKKQNGIVPSSMLDMLVLCVEGRVVQFVCAYSGFADDKPIQRDATVKELGDFCNLVFSNVEIESR